MVLRYAKIISVVCILFVILSITACSEADRDSINGGVVTLDVDKYQYDKAPVESLKASCFLIPKTMEAFNIFMEDFPDYNAVRLNFLEYAGTVSTDIDTFITYVQAQDGPVSEVFKRCDNVIIVISKMPKWLSSNSSEVPLSVDGGWMEYNAHSPTDYSQWEQMVFTTVSYFNKFKAEGKSIYFEFWNEPDIGYWKEDTKSFLKLYESTVKAVKLANPEAKVGGATVNQYDGTIDKESQPVNVELIKYAKAKNLPLDFISWHYFSIFTKDIEDAKKLYDEALAENNYSYTPEFIVSEWNSAHEARETEYSAALMAETFFEFYHTGIDKQTVAAWEDFEANEKQGYGLMFQGAKEMKPVFHLFGMVDSMCRESIGMYGDGDDLKYIISKKNDDTYSIMCWKFVNYENARALQYLLEDIALEEFHNDYQNMENIRKHISMGSSINGKRDKEFEQAKKINDEDLEQVKIKQEYTIKFTGYTDVEVLNSKSVKNDLTEKPLLTEENSLKVILERNEVLRFDVKLKK